MARRWITWRMRVKDLIVSIKEARELLGKDAVSMTDHEIEKLIRDLDELIRLIFKMFRERDIFEE